MKNYTILYVHGMGGGEDSRIPSILNQHINEFVNPEDTHIDVIVRTYDIDPQIAMEQVTAWFNELEPQLVIGESLGSLHAIRLGGVPHIFVSPAVGAARWMSIASYIPGAAAFMRNVFKPRPGSRQSLDSRVRYFPIIAGCVSVYCRALRHVEARIISSRFSELTTPIAVGG